MSEQFLGSALPTWAQILNAQHIAGDQDIFQRDPVASVPKEVPATWSTFLFSFQSVIRKLPMVLWSLGHPHDFVLMKDLFLNEPCILSTGQSHIGARSNHICALPRLPAATLAYSHMCL